jgi:uncharacterized protein YacL
MDFSSVNYVSVLVAGVAAFVIGFLWHGPVFGKQWISLQGIPQSEVDAMKAKGMGPMVPHMIAAFVQQCVTAFAISYLANGLSVTGAGPAVVFAVFLWVGFVVTLLLNRVLWERESMNLYFYKLAYHLVSMVVVTLIVVLWK